MFAAVGKILDLKLFPPGLFKNPVPYLVVFEENKSDTSSLFFIEYTQEAARDNFCRGKNWEIKHEVFHKTNSVCKEKSLKV